MKVDKCPRCGQNSIESGGHIFCAECIKQYANREKVEYRYDLLVPDFIKELATLAHVGARKYGENNWQLSRLKGENSPVNHLFSHLISYINKEPHDHLGSYRDHLVSVAFNAMMEWWYEKNVHD